MIERICIGILDVYEKKEKHIADLNMLKLKMSEIYEESKSEHGTMKTIRASSLFKMMETIHRGIFEVQMISFRFVESILSSPEAMRRYINVNRFDNVKHHLFPRDSTSTSLSPRESISELLCGIEWLRGECNLSFSGFGSVIQEKNDEIIRSLCRIENDLITRLRVSAESEFSADDISLLEELISCFKQLDEKHETIIYQHPKVMRKYIRAIQLKKLHEIHLNSTMEKLSKIDESRLIYTLSPPETAMLSKHFCNLNPDCVKMWDDIEKLNLSFYEGIIPSHDDVEKYLKTMYNLHDRTHYIDRAITLSRLNAI